MMGCGSSVLVFASVKPFDVTIRELLFVKGDVSYVNRDVVTVACLGVVLDDSTCVPVVLPRT
jgi:hypothetical protein